MTNALRCARLIDGTGAPPRDGVVVLVEDGHIREIVPANGWSPGDTVESTIDLAGTVMPGMVDAHDHVCFDATDPKDLLRRESDAWSVLRAAGNARRILEAGITTLRDMGEKNHIDILLRDAIAQGVIPGPHLLVSGQALTITGGVQSWFPGGEVDSVVEVRKAVRRQAKAGVDQIKMFATGSAATTAVDPLAPCFSREEIAAAVEEAHRTGRKIAVHCHGGQAADDAVDVGVDSIEHGAFLTDEVLRAMAARGTFLVLTSGYAHVIAADPGATPAMRERCERMIEAYARTTRRARELGVRIAIGNDENHGQNVLEMRNLVAAGYTAMEAIQAATIWGAQLCGVADVAGTIEPGKRADVIAVDGDPLRDIDAVGSVNFVIKAGTVYKRAC